MQYNEDIKKIADFINDKISYAEQHKKSDLDILYGFIDLIGDLMEYSKDREDWYSLCNTILPEENDENAIS